MRFPRKSEGKRKNIAFIRKRRWSELDPINRDGLWYGPSPIEMEPRRHRRTEKRQGDRKIGERLGVHWRGNHRDKRAEASPLIVGRAAWNSTNVWVHAMSVGVSPCWKIHYITTVGVATFPAARASWLIVKLLHRRYLLVNGVGPIANIYRGYFCVNKLWRGFFFVILNSCTYIS